MFRIIAIFYLVIAQSAGLAITLDSQDARIGVEIDIFSRDGVLPSQDYQSNISIFFQSESLWQWNQSRDSLSFKPYFRVDQRDPEKSHADIRELIWMRSNSDWSLSIGLGKVFWGVTEFNHLVDVINQIDLVEGIDGEAKLGQPMINLSLINHWGALDFFVLPGFRERTFAGKDGRLRALVEIDKNRVFYESPEMDKHIDFAVRWSDSFKHFDLGIYLFDGTNREPSLDIQPVLNKTQFTSFVAIASYQQMTQLGIDFQGVLDNWLFKWEALSRITSKDHFLASQAGIEYTFYNVKGRSIDVGVLFEYGWDERGLASTSVVQNDFFVGSRISFNDFKSSELLLGMAYDQDYYSYSAFLEFTQSASDNTQVSLQANFFQAKNPADILNNIAGDDYIQLTFERFF